MTKDQQIAKLAKEVKQLKAQLNKKATEVEGTTNLDLTVQRDRVRFDITLGWNPDAYFGTNPEDYKGDITEELAKALRDCLVQFGKKTDIPFSKNTRFV